MEIKKRSPFKIFRAVVFALVLREVRGRFGANRLGAFWFVFEPLAHIVVLMSLYVLLRAHRNSGPDLPMFLVTGIIPFLLFKNIALKGMDAVSANKALFSYRQIKPFDTIVARAILECALSLVVYGLVIFGLGFWGGHDVGVYHVLAWFSAIAVGIVFSFGLALIFCVIGEAMPELKTLIRLLFMPLYFISGVIIPLWLIPERLLKWALWNPFVHIIDSVRRSTFEHYPTIKGVSLSYAALVALVTLFLGMVMYRARRQQLLAI